MRIKGSNTGNVGRVGKYVREDKCEFHIGCDYHYKLGGKIEGEND